VDRVVVAASIDEQIGEREPGFERIRRPLQHFASADYFGLLCSGRASALLRLFVRANSADATEQTKSGGERSQRRDARAAHL
jgi:hypothetical protein